MIKAFKPDVILVDTMNDTISEEEFIHMVKSDNELEETKVIKFTAAINIILEEVKAQGFDGLVTKPIDVQDFMKYIKDLVEEKE